MLRPLISIIIPCKNGGNYLAEALEGIKKQNMNVEIIVINDGSTDKTEEIANKYGCKIISNATSLGPVKGKNQALKIAAGDYIMFHDHDDIMENGTLQKLYTELENNPELSAVMAKVQDFVSPEMTDEEKRKTAIKKEPYYGLFTGAVLIRKEVFDCIGLFDENVTAGEIIDWQGKMKKHSLKIKKLDFVATKRRLHTSNFGKTQQKTEFKDYTTLLRAKLKR